MPYWHKQHYTEVIPTPRKKRLNLKTPPFIIKKNAKATAVYLVIGRFISFFLKLSLIQNAKQSNKL